MTMTDTPPWLTRLLPGLVAALVLLVPHLPWWATLAAALLIGWRYALARFRGDCPNSHLLLLLAAGALGGVWWMHDQQLGRDAGVEFLLLVIVLKLLEANSPREGAFLAMAGSALVFCAFLFSQSPLTAFGAVVTLCLLTAAMLQGVKKNGQASIFEDVRLALRLLLQALPFMLIGFLLFPRSELPRWRVPQDAVRAMTGIGDRMAPGSIAHLAVSQQVAFRAEFSGELPSSSQLYWRGPVLTLFDGRQWIVNDDPDALWPDRISYRSAPLHYSVMLEPHNQRWLFTLDLPVVPPPGAMLTTDFQMMANQPVQAYVRYEMVSAPDAQIGRRLNTAQRKRLLQLPPDGNPRSRALASQWVGQALDEDAIVQRALDVYRSGFAYTMSPPVIKGDMVDSFLFGTRQGYCEHFAGSFVFLMRAAGIPARVVLGYRGGEFNALGSHYVVRQALAHAWAEVWLKGRGWVRIDPVTVLPVSATNQVANGSAEDNAATTTANSQPASITASVTMQGRVMSLVEWLQKGWKRQVLGYQQQDQRKLLRLISGKRPSKTMLLSLMAVLTMAWLCLTSWLIMRRSATHVDPALAAWTKFQRKFSRAGLPPLPGEGPRDFVARCIRYRPDLRAEIIVIGTHYQHLRYRGDGDIAALRRAIRKFSL